MLGLMGCYQTIDGEDVDYPAQTTLVDITIVNGGWIVTKENGDSRHFPNGYIQWAERHDKPLIVAWKICDEWQYDSRFSWSHDETFIDKVSNAIAAVKSFLF